MQASYDYDPYGAPTRTDETGGVTADYRYAGLVHHAPSGLYLAYYRAYSADGGRWMSRDPIREAGGVNLHAYVEGNPVNRVDPDGRFAVIPWAIACAGNPACWLPPAVIVAKCASDLWSKVLNEADDGDQGRKKNPPDVGPPDGHIDGPRRGRDYGPDGRPIRDYDNPHQGADYPHVHEWPSGVREEPGRPYSPYPPGD